MTIEPKVNSNEVSVTELFKFKIAGCNHVSVSLQTSVISAFPIRPNFQRTCVNKN